MSFLRTSHHSNSKPHKFNMEKTLFKIVSGGQTGVDRAALDVAIKLEINYGGWCPKGRKAEDGIIPINYQMSETASDDYSERTKLNIRDSDGTLIFVPSMPIKVTDGTILSINEVNDKHKPYFIMDLSNEFDIRTCTLFRDWISENNIRTLNVAGPRESQAPGIHNKSFECLVDLIKFVFNKDPTLNNSECAKAIYVKKAKL